MSYYKNGTNAVTGLEDAAIYLHQVQESLRVIDKSTLTTREASALRLLAMDCLRVAGFVFPELKDSENNPLNY